MKPIVLVLLGLAILGGLFAALRSRRPTTPASDQDHVVLDQLRQNGADLSKPTELLFYVYAPTRDGAKRVAAGIRSDSLKSEVREAATGDGTWLCLVTGNLVPSLERVKSIGSQLTALAAAVGGEYDGWEAAVTK